MRSILRNAIVLTAMLAVTAIIGYGQKKTGKELRDAVNRVDKASDVMVEVMKITEKSIPRDLLQKAKAVVVFPGALKGAFIVGAQGGSGVAISRVGRGWSAPAFLNMAGGSLGLQVGGAKTDYVILVMNDKGLKNLIADKFEIGGEGSVAAGPVGRTAAASTNATMDAEILTYSRSKGLFAGISLKGVVISQDETMNQAVYQKSAKEIIGSTPIPAEDAPSPLQKFGKVVGSYIR